MSQRTGKELILATREFAHEYKLRSWVAVLSTFVFLAACLAGSVLLPILIGRLLLSVFAGLFVVRIFVLYHDHQHHAILDR